MTFDTIDEAIKTFVKIIESEAQALGETPKIEQSKKIGHGSRLMVIAVKHGAQTFRVTLNWVSDERAPLEVTNFAWAYIEPVCHGAHLPSPRPSCENSRNRTWLPVALAE